MNTADPTVSSPSMPGLRPPEQRRGLDLHPSFVGSSALPRTPDSALLDKIQQWASLGLGRAIAAERIKSAVLLKTESLNLKDLHLTVLPSFISELTSVKHLSVDGNRLKQLPLLPPGLVTLTCVANLLENLPDLPASLQGLYVGSNRLRLLPTLPDSLRVLSAPDNRLVQLPPLPVSIVSVHFNDNDLQRLPRLHDGLENMFVGNNRIDSLPTLPDSLRRFNVAGNQVSLLPILPEKLEHLWIGAAPEREQIIDRSIAHWQSALESLHQRPSLSPGTKIEEDMLMAESQITLLQSLR